MNRFETRWKKVVAAARYDAPAPPDSAPFGFAERVLARRIVADPGWALLWEVFTLRFLGTMAVVLMLALTYMGISDRPDALATPQWDSAVAESIAWP